MYISEKFLNEKDERGFLTRLNDKRKASAKEARGKDIADMQQGLKDCEKKNGKGSDKCNDLRDGLRGLTSMK